MAHVEWTDTGEESFIAIGKYIAEQNQSVERALQVMERVEERCRLTADFPGSGTRRDDLGLGVRCVVIDNLVVIYRPIENGIRILLVAHGHQDIPSLFRDRLG